MLNVFDVARRMLVHAERLPRESVRNLQAVLSLEAGTLTQVEFEAVARLPRTCAPVAARPVWEPGDLVDCLVGKLPEGIRQQICLSSTMAAAIICACSESVLVPLIANEPPREYMMRCMGKYHALREDWVREFRGE